MATEFNDKGKIFTNVVTKTPISVVIQTASQRIEGLMHISPSGRVKDELNTPEQFLALTNAVIYNDGGTVLYRSQFLAINRDHIIWLLPEADIQA